MASLKSVRSSRLSDNELSRVYVTIPPYFLSTDGGISSGNKLKPLYARFSHTENPLKVSWDGQLDHPEDKVGN